MRIIIKSLIFFICLSGIIAFTNVVHAKEIKVTPQDNLQHQLDEAVDGDILVLQEGRYQGNFVLNHAVTITTDSNNTKKVIIDAQGDGHALLLKNSHITIENVFIENWGSDLTEQHSGIYSDEKASHIIIQNNHLKGDGFGIWLQKGESIKVINNNIEGNLSIRSADRGNGIQLSSVKKSMILGNETSSVRDGIYVQNSQNNTIKKNTMHNLRYGIHYMYSYDNSIIDNMAYNTRAGYAMMSSRRLIIENNISIDSEDYGFLLNFITQSRISGNRIKNVWTKPENKVLGRDGKGLFVYNSGYNTISNNIVDTAEIGIHLTAGSEEVKIFGNSFIDNPTQVKYVSNKKQEWSQDGIGNYWSNYLGWDMNNDNVGDVIFEPNDGIDKLVWQYPEMKMLMDSPAVIILRWVQRQFPILKPPGVKDSFPLMKSPHFDNTVENKKVGVSDDGIANTKLASANVKDTQ